MKLFIKIFKYSITFIFGIMIVILSVFLLSSLFSKKDYNQFLGYSFFEVTSYSMYPELDKGDLVVVKKRDSDYYQVGMTVTYQVSEGTTPVTHKIVSRNGDIIITRGINSQTNNADDDPFDVKCIIGEVVFVIDDYADFVSFIKNPIGLMILVCIAWICFESLSYCESKIKNKKKEVKEEE